MDVRDISSTTRSGVVALWEEGMEEPVQEELRRGPMERQPGLPLGERGVMSPKTL